jgi:hypothetical protein
MKERVSIGMKLLYYRNMNRPEFHKIKKYNYREKNED